MHDAKLWKFITVAIIAGVLTVAASSGIAQDNETITGQMYGTSTQMGRKASFTLTINKYSTPEDRAVLVEAFKKGQSEGLADVLERMKAVGHISIPGTLGYEVNYIRVIPTATGRKIRFVTNRRIAFGEASNVTRSKEYNLTAGEINLDEKDPNKSDGSLLPASKLTITKDGDLQWDLYQNPWRVAGIKDWKPRAAESK